MNQTVGDEAKCADLLANERSIQEVSARSGADQRQAQPLTAAHRDVGTQRAIDGTPVPWQASGAENPQLRRLAPAPIFVVRSVLWP
jgi:hypothetical protein